MSDQCTVERFLSDVDKHEMSVIRDDGVSRHIRFKRPGTSCYFFDLITWPGHLCISGDCGTYVFQRLEDMFEFFRTDRDYGKRKGEKLYANLGYWGEKIVSESRDGGIQEFSVELFKAVIKEYFDSHFQDEIANETAMRAYASDENPLDASELAEMEDAAGKRDEIWQAIEDEVLCAADDEHQACHAAHDFKHEGFQFEDFFEHNLKDYTFRFIWNCYAIAWGIEKYDWSKVVVNEEAA